MIRLSQRNEISKTFSIIVGGQELVTKLDEGESHRLVNDDQTFSTELNMREIEKDSSKSLKSKLWDEDRTI